MADAEYVALASAGRNWGSGQRNMSVLVQSHDNLRSTTQCQFGNVYANTNSEKTRILNFAFFA